MKIYGNVRDAKSLENNERMAIEARKKLEHERMESEFAGGSAVEKKAQEKVSAQAKKKRSAKN